MMTKHTLLIAAGIVCLSLAGCKSKAKAQGGNTQPSPTTQPTVYKGVTNDSCAVEVNFGSYGAGIDGKTYEAVVAKIDEKKLHYSAKSIGREGETRLCLPLTELKGKERSEFIEQLKKLVALGQLTSVSIR